MFNILRRRTARSSRRPRCVRLGVESLEDRRLLAVYTVNSLSDLSLAAGVNPANGKINGTNTVTLRSAIEAANETPGGNTINLKLAGTYRITLAPTTPNESDNLAGEFAILPEGNLTIQNTSRRTVTVDGGGLGRVFDINPGNTDDPATHFTVTMSGFTITDGRAFDATGDNPDGAFASGGGIRDQGNQSLTLNNMIVTNNSATADGGGVSMENTVDTPWTLTLNKSTISNNRAGDAGGGVDTDGSGKVVVTSSTISGNTTVNQGAGIWLDAIEEDSAILTVTQSSILNNMALNGPTGGIGNAGNNTFVPATGPVVQGAVTITASTVAHNFGGGSGGGFGDQNNLGTLVVLNSTFVGNSATSNGGGIQEGGPNLTINDSTITGNTAIGVGGGVYTNSDDGFVLNNTIVAGNFANDGEANFQGAAPDVFGAVTSGQGNFIGIGDSHLTGITNGTGGNQIGTAASPIDPLVGPLQNNGGPTQTEAPLKGSPVINAGVNSVIPAGTKTDQRGLPRIVNTTVDIGAVEVQNQKHKHKEKSDHCGDSDSDRPAEKPSHTQVVWSKAEHHGWRW